jgi:hypothetical protein
MATALLSLPDSGSLDVRVLASPNSNSPHSCTNAHRLLRVCRYQAGQRATAEREQGVGLDGNAVEVWITSASPWHNVGSYT